MTLLQRTPSRSASSRAGELRVSRGTYAWTVAHSGVDAPGARLPGERRASAGIPAGARGVPLHGTTYSNGVEKTRARGGDRCHPRAHLSALTSRVHLIIGRCGPNVKRNL